MTRDQWFIGPGKKLQKAIEKLPQAIRPLAFALLRDLEVAGPRQPTWPNYSSLGNQKKKIPKNAHHCHLKKGKPTYVACWAVADEKNKLIEVFYVGTHENAPY